MPLKILPASGSGSATLVSVAGTTTNDTLTLPAATGTVLLNTTANNQATTITQTIYTSGSGTYTTPAGVKWLRVRMVGGGGGGGSGASGNGNAGSAGGNVTFGSSFLTATGGFGGGGNNTSQPAPQSNAPTGGDINIPGGAALPGLYQGSTQYLTGGTGGASAFGGGSVGGFVGAGATSVTAGAGGGGGGISVTNGTTGGGGGAGGYLEKIISSPSATYSYAVGAGGNGATAATGGYAGGAGCAGIIIIEEHYNW